MIVSLFIAFTPDIIFSIPFKKASNLTIAAIHGLMFASILVSMYTISEGVSGNKSCIVKPKPFKVPRTSTNNCPSN